MKSKNSSTRRSRSRSCSRDSIVPAQDEEPGDELNDTLRKHRISLRDGKLLTAQSSGKWTPRLVMDLCKNTCGLCARSTSEIDYFVVSPVCLHGACDRCYIRCGDSCPVGSYCTTKANRATSVGLPESAIALHFDSIDDDDDDDDDDANASANNANSDGDGASGRDRNRRTITSKDSPCVTCSSAVEGDAILRTSLQLLLSMQGPTRFVRQTDPRNAKDVRVCDDIRIGPIPLCPSCNSNAMSPPEMINEMLYRTPDIVPVTPVAMARVSLLPSIQHASNRVQYSDVNAALASLLSTPGAAGMVDAVRCLLGLGRTEGAIHEHDALLLGASVYTVQICTLNAALVGMLSANHGDREHCIIDVTRDR
jgi:hypothetical protein